MSFLTKSTYFHITEKLFITYNREKIKSLWHKWCQWHVFLYQSSWDDLAEIGWQMFPYTLWWANLCNIGLFCTFMRFLVLVQVCILIKVRYRKTCCVLLHVIYIYYIYIYTHRYRVHHIYGNAYLIKLFISKLYIY